MDGLAAHWTAERPEQDVVHLDAAAAAPTSRAVRRAVREHLDAEARLGGYRAEELAAPVLDDARARLGRLLGQPGDAVAFTHGATEALDALLDSWPLPPGARVAVVPSEWGPNLAAFRARGLTLESLDTEADGTLDLDGLRHRLADDPPALVHLTRLASHRALAQPTAGAGALCRTAGVPLWVDAAQALGHVEVSGPADAVYATSRKWLAGPRGVGVVAVHPDWQERLRLEHRRARRPGPVDPRPVRLLEPAEAHVAGRVGLAEAVAEHERLGPERVRQALAEAGRRTRQALSGVPGWRLLDAPDAPGAITALQPVSARDLMAVRAALLAAGVLVTVAGPARAPGDLTAPVLRFSPHLGVSDEELDRAAAALAAA